MLAIMDYKVAIAVVSIVIALVGYSFYFRDIFAGRDVEAHD